MSDNTAMILRSVARTLKHSDLGYAIACCAVFALWGVLLGLGF